MNDASNTENEVQYDDSNYATEPKVYAIVETNLPTLEAKFEKLAKRTKRLGVDAPSFVLVGSPVKEYEVVTRWDGENHYSWVRQAGKNLGRECNYTGDVRIVRYVSPVGAREVKLVGWTFIGTLDMEMGADAIIVRSVPGQVVPAEFRTKGNFCEHCKTNRFRKATLVVHHDDGRYMQIGRNCAADFFGRDVERVLASIEMMGMMSDIFASMEDEEENEMGGCDRTPSMFDLREFLAFTAASVREHGWVSRSKAEFNEIPTADRALTALIDTRKSRRA